MIYYLQMLKISKLLPTNWTLFFLDATPYNVFHGTKKEKKTIQLEHFHFLRNFIKKLVCRAEAESGEVSQLLWHVTLNWPFSKEPYVSGLMANERHIVD